MVGVSLDCTQSYIPRQGLLRNPELSISAILAIFFALKIHVSLHVPPGCWDYGKAFSVCPEACNSECTCLWSAACASPSVHSVPPTPSSHRKFISCFQRALHPVGKLSLWCLVLPVLLHQQHYTAQTFSPKAAGEITEGQLVSGFL